MRATALLRKDHRNVRDIVSKLGGAASGGRKGLLERLRSVLRLHLKLEEELFYPSVKGRPSRKAEASLQGVLDNHLALDGHLWELSSLDPRGGRFERALGDLSGSVDRHIREEQGLFKEARRLLSRKSLERIGAEMQERARVVGLPVHGG